MTRFNLVIILVLQLFVTPGVRSEGRGHARLNAARNNNPVRQHRVRPPNIRSRVSSLLRPPVHVNPRLCDRAGRTRKTAQPLALQPVEGSPGEFAQSVTTSICMAGDRDVFSMSLPTSGALHISTSGTTNTFGRLLDVAGNVVAIDDNSGEGPNFTILKIVPAGNYYVEVSHSHRYGKGFYDLDIVLAKDPKAFDDHGDSVETATSVALGSSVTGEIEFARDVDTFTFDVAEDSLVAIFTSGSINTFGTLMDANGSTVAQSDNGPTDNFVMVLNLTPGTYTLRLQHCMDLGTGTYTLHLGYDN
jgi:hypothetical protein